MKENSLEIIAKVVHEVTGISLSKIKEKNRKRHVVIARHLFFYFSKFYTKHSLYEIGSFINRNHSSVIHGAKRYNDVDFLLKHEKFYFFKIKNILDFNINPIDEQLILKLVNQERKRIIKSNTIINQLLKSI